VPRASTKVLHFTFSVSPARITGGVLQPVSKKKKVNFDIRMDTNTLIITISSALHPSTQNRNGGCLDLYDIFLSHFSHRGVALANHTGFHLFLPEKRRHRLDGILVRCFEVEVLYMRISFFEHNDLVSRLFFRSHGASHMQKKHTGFRHFLGSPPGTL
jgi:hypothetical protein